MPDFRENRGFGVVSGDLGGSKGFCANSHVGAIFTIKLGKF